MISRIRIFQILMPVLIVLASVSGFAQQAPVQLPQGVQYVTSVEGINEYRLQNGLRVVLFADPTKANITVNITYMVGSRHEDYGETGMAHLLEHLMFKGSTNHPDIPKELQDHGTRPNGSTWLDRTNYFETFQATDENLKWALALEADRMVNSFIAKKDLDSEMTVVRNEFEAGENNPQNVLEERVMSTAFLWHNYGKSTIGARSDIERVPIDRLQAFYHHFYQPDNAMLVVAGKFDEAKTLGLIQQDFSAIPKPARQLRRTYTSEPTQDGERDVTLRRVGDVQALCVVHHVPAGSHEDFPAVQMATQILGDAPSGRLYKALVESGKAASVNTTAFQLMEPGVMLIMASVRMEKSLDDALDTMLATIDDIKSKPFTDEEVNRAKTQRLKNFDLMLNNSEQVALNLSEWQAMGDWRLLFFHRDRVRKVTREQVQQAAAKYFIASNRTVGKFIPDKNPLRAEIPEPPVVAELLKDYKGDAAIAKGEEFDPSPENIDKRTLRPDQKEGLKLSLLSKKTRGQQINALITLRFGDENSLKGLSTAASMAGQMLMRGTGKHSRQQIRDEFDRLKAQVTVNGSASSAMANIQTTRENFKAVMDLVAEILEEPSFPDSEFEQLRQQQLAQLENQKSEPQAMVSTALQRHLSPYPKDDVRYVPTLQERIDEIKSLTLDQVKAFHKSFYGATNGEVTIIGDFDPEAAQQQIGQLFGTWKSPKKYVRVQNRYQKLLPKAEVFEAPDKANAMWAAATMFRMTDTDPDYPAMVLNGYIIGGGMNSRLFARIRGKEGLSYGVGGQIMAPTQDDAAVMLAFAICAPQNAQKVEASFKDEMTQILEKGFKAEEVENAKKSWLQAQQVSRAQDRELAMRLGGGRFWNRTMAFDSDLQKKVMSLTPDQLQAALRKYVDLSQFGYFRGGDFKKVNVTW